jgi:hypothetical protein
MTRCEVGLTAVDNDGGDISKRVAKVKHDDDDYIYITAIGLTPDGSSEVHICTQTSAQNTENGTDVTLKKSLPSNLGSAGRAPSLRVIYPGICHTTEEKARKPLS